MFNQPNWLSCGGNLLYSSGHCAKNNGHHVMKLASLQPRLRPSIRCNPSVCGVVDVHVQVTCTRVKHHLLEVLTIRRVASYSRENFRIDEFYSKNCTIFYFNPKSRKIEQCNNIEIKSIWIGKILIKDKYFFYIIFCRNLQ